MAWAPDYVTAVELAAFMRIGDTDDNAVLAQAVTAASRAVDKATGRQFGLVAAPEARYYTAFYRRQTRRWVVEIDDLMTSTGLLVAYDSADAGTWTTSVTDGIPAPANAAATGRPWTALEYRTGPVTSVGPIPDAVRVTARWGWTTVPEAVKYATLMQGSRFAVRRSSPYGVAGTGDQGSELRLLSRVDPDVAVTLRPYRRIWAVA